MSMRMLIDARHREETRVAVVKGNRIEEFDFESAERQQLKGNIYLAKVTRVEPSLQAAFVDYGGNRHGFLAFSEIHPDYYQIPKEDREALLREEAEHAAEEEALRAREDERQEQEENDEAAGRDEDAEDHEGEGESGEEGEGGEDRPRPRSNSQGSEDAVESLRQKRMNLRRRYKIQDVIRRRQVLLVQVVKEERGNKGAALTTYLSLAGRYCVLMPNTSHGGGISRKISNAADRKRLKSIMAELALPKTMGCIVRTAGLSRTKVEIKRDFDYLARLWDEIRERTLKSAAPSLIHEDSDLIKRAIRDIYNRDIDEVIIEGEEGYRQARAFMKLLMPSHVKKVQLYSDPVPLFQRFGVEDQLAAMYQPLVQLKSGGYLVINPTEALVSIDINSGRSTREHNIEQTATATNLEAANEIARQLRLRDMAGLIVIDFIDMENNSNVRKVEKAMKEALKNDRARIQVGRISSFGLFEMSRQRLRTGVLEASTRQCPHCEGTGLVRTASSAGLSALRMLEDEAARGRGSQLLLRASQEAAFYVLNRKRGELAEIEERYGVVIEIVQDGTLEGARMSVESGGPPPQYAPRLPAPVLIEAEDEEILVDEDEEELEEAEAAADGHGEPRGERGDGEDRGEGRSRRRRRRRRRGGRDREDEAAHRAQDGEQVELSDDAETGGEAPERHMEGEGEGDGRRRRSRRGRRGGRRRPGEDEAQISSEGGEPTEELAPLELVAAAAQEAEAETVVEDRTEAPRPRRRPRARKAEGDVAEVAPAPASTEETVEAAGQAAAKPKRTRRKAAAPEPQVEGQQPEGEQVEAVAAEAKPRRRARSKAAANDDAVAQVAADAVVEPHAEEGKQDSADQATEEGPPRRGWWQRTFGN